MADVDPITFAVVRNKFMSIANGMQETGFRTGVTTFMYEIKDCSFAILDKDAQVIAQGSEGILLFLGSLGPAVENCLEIMGKENLSPGDVVVSTVPDITGSHTSDAVVFAPIFVKDRLFGFAASKAHWIDLGAKDSYPADARNIYEEGLRIPPTKLIVKGKTQEPIWGIIRENSRAPALVWGDYQAQLAAIRFAEKQVMELVEKYGLASINAVVTEMLDYSETMTRLAIEKIPDGTWSAEDHIDNNGLDLKKQIKIKVTVTVKGSDITVDYSGSDGEQSGPMNGLWVTTLSATRSAIKSLTNPDLPTNEGFNRPITVIAPKGCIFNTNPGVPSFLSASVANFILELINNALYEIIPTRIPACSGGDVIGNGLFGIDAGTSQYWGTITPSIIGQGASKTFDGNNYVQFTAAGGSQNIPVEILETRFPISVEKLELIQDSGGAGRFRGGLGSRIQYRLLSPATFYAFIEKGTSPHWGYFGGKNGLRNFATITSKQHGEIEVLKTSGIQLEKGDTVCVTAGGGGGYGSPLERDPEKVRQDVKNGYVSIECAKSEYGVRIDSETGDIDLAATLATRQAGL